MQERKRVITIARQIGAGGHAVGERLARELNIPFYDDNILKITSETSAIGEQYFRLADEKAGGNLLCRIFDSIRPELGEPKVGERMTKPENLFRFQAKLIKELARGESCIICGRAGNYLLQEEGIPYVLNVFVHADFDKRVERVQLRDSINREEAEQRVRKSDRERAEFYKYYTGREWTDLRNYDLTIDSSKLTIDQVASLVKEGLKERRL